MVERTRGHDWASTSAGSLERWPEVFLTSVNLLLGSRFPTVIFWGQELSVFYNDAYLPLMGDKHPSALGASARDVWKEAWHLLGPQVDTVLVDGGTIYQENVLVPVIRREHVGDVYWTYSYSPIYTGLGKVAGVLIVCHDVTGEVDAKNKLVESEARARRVLQSIGDAVIVTDADACVTSMNPIAEELTGWTEEEARGVALSQVFHVVDGETRKEVESPADKVKRLGVLVGLAGHTVLIRRDGHETHIDDSGAPIRNDAGELTGMVLVFRNIDKRRAAERERATLAEQVQQIQDATTDSVLSIDRNWCISHMNGPARLAAGPLADAVGRNFWEQFPETVYEGSPFVEHYHRAMEERIAGSFEAFYPEPLNIWVQVQVRPTNDGIVLFFRDFTAQKQAEVTLRETREQAVRSESQLKVITDALPSYISYLDPQFRYRRVNHTYEKWFGRPSADILGKTIDEVLGKQGADSIREHLGRALAGEPQHFEYRIKIGDDERVLSVAHIPDIDEAGHVRGVVIQGQDITDQKRAEVALIQSEKLAAVGRLAASIAHEINNPLESVTNLLYLARAAHNLGEVQEYLDVAERELRRVSVISNQTLRFYKQSTKPTAVTAEDLFESVLSIYQGRIVNSRVHVERRMRTGKAVECFEGEVRQVLNNLVGNAVDAMHPVGGRLLLRSRETTHPRTGERGLVLTVADTGRGMTSQVQKKIFDAFYTTKGIGGTGLGLWVSKEIADRHQGELRVRSSQEQHANGSVFTLFLPFAAVRR